MSPYRESAMTNVEEQDYKTRLFRIFGIFCIGWTVGLASANSIMSDSFIENEYNRRVTESNESRAAAEDAERRHALTLEQDEALCRRSFPTTYVGGTNCSWGGSRGYYEHPDGVRICSCYTNAGWNRRVWTSRENWHYITENRASMASH